VPLLGAGQARTAAEAARLLNRPSGTVMSRLSRARERLQQEIDGTASNPSANVVQLRSNP